MTDDAFRMPAEWEKQAAVWLAWPHHEKDWPGKFAPIPWVYTEILRHLTQATNVHLLVQSAAAEKHVRTVLKRAGISLKQVTLHQIPTDRVWLRDSGPIFVYSPPLKGVAKKIMLDFRFNAWAKYPNHKLDDKVPERIQAINKFTRIQPMHKGKRVVLEGGSIDVNGRGTLLTTEECLISKIQCRNPGFTHGDYETIFEKYLGISNVLWLGNGIVGDDTHGHVDDLARFINPTTAVTVVENNRKDDNFAALQDNLKRLKKARDQRGKPLNVIELPMPRVMQFEGTRLPASYANFLISNNLVLVPTFNDPNDRVALNILSEAMPKHEIVGIHSVDLVWGFGTLHCMSQQESSTSPL